MKKFKIIEKFILTISLATLALNSLAQGFGEKKLINNDWSFMLGDDKYLGAEHYDHSKWRKLDLPHDWSVEATASSSLASCTGYLPGGIGWYRKDLEIPSSKQGEKVYVYFGGVYNNSDVFINGKWLGKRPNGYISFMYDLTPYINYGDRNVIAVRVDHSDDSDSRWYTGSGIYQDVSLVYANPLHIGQWGVSYSAKVENGKANIAIQTEIDNNTDKSSKVVIKHYLCDKNGDVVSTVSGKAEAQAEKLSVNNQTLSISSPNLWDLESPYLYTIKTELICDGKIIDKSEVKAGIRTLEFDSNKGFALNGKNMKVKGVCIHHDAGALGAAVPKEVWRRRLLKLKEIGCNAIRLSHNPFSSNIHDLCDELGLLINDEAFDEWEYPKKKWVQGWNVGEPSFQGSSHYFREWCKIDMADLVRRDRNHPSIMMWSIGNEVDYPNDPYSHPILNDEGISQIHVKGYQPNQPYADRLGEIAKELVAVVKAHDTSRPVTAALAGAIMSNETEYPGALDIVGYNYTEYRYEEDHKKYPNRVFYGSETRHDLNAWKAVRDNDYIFGQFIWTGYDYLGEAGRWPSRGFTTGMIDITGQIKPNGYFRRSLWLESPNVYVGTYKFNPEKDVVNANAPAVWNYEEGEMIRVVAFTNCEQAELHLNGKVVGKKCSYNDKTAIIHWDIPYKPGELKVIAYNKGKKATEDSIISSGLPYAVTASLDKTKNVKVGDYLHIEIDIKDEKGVPVVLADNEITCTINGGARLLGLDSAEGNAMFNYKDNVQRCKNGKLLAYVKAENSGEITVKFTSPLLKPATIKFNVE